VATNRRNNTKDPLRPVLLAGTRAGTSRQQTLGTGPFLLMQGLPSSFEENYWTAFMFGYTEEQIANFGLTFGVGAFMLFMLFIIGHLAWESKAGKFGTFVLFLGLAFGMVGFVAKYFIQWFMESK
jgi:hypothetical protein